jgi:hypothetical protein
MADRDLVHQPANAGGGLETGARPFDPPLLPYEVALIEALGCSEQEYRQFVRHAQLQARVRPAEYAHIPDVVNTPLAVAIVSLVLGLASTAVSILLAPKAPALESPAKIKGKKLADQIGPSRFNQTTSFDNVSSLAEYGQPIPIPFGKRGTGSDGALTGGLILAPALVWSRIYSYGSYQAFEGIYVAGEYGVDAPKLGGIRVGTTALNSLGNHEFAVYWSSQLGENRPGPARLIAGTQDGGVSGTTGRVTFTAPTEDGQFSTGFSMTYTPQADTSFGTATPVFNGTAYRFNWEVVSAPYESTEGSDNKDARQETQAQRRKIAGSNADVLHKYENQPSEDVGKIGQPGVGRAYSRRMGFVAHSRTNGGNNIENRTIVDVRVDDVLTFEINKRNWSDFQQEDFKGTEVNLKDLKNSADSWRAQASDLLTVGSKWIIGSSVWVVEDRDPDLWTKDTTQHIYFRCTAIFGVATVGIPGTRTVRQPLGGYEGPWPGPGEPPEPLSSGGFNSNKHCGAAFFNICRLHMASIRPVRRDAEVVEIGIRSQVWNRANGLCNFNAIPSPGKDGKLHRMDKKNITLTTPRMDKYFERTSCFSLWVRPVQQYGQTQQPWTRIPEVICVTGNAPILLYNYLRIRPRQAGYYEYRLVPRTGSDIAINSIDTNLALRLNSRTGDIIGQDYDTPYGAFRLTTNGEMVTIAQIQRNDELVTDPSDIEAITPVVSTTPTALDQYAQSASNGSDQQVINAWLRQVLGRATDYAGGSNSASLTHDKPGVGRIVFTVTADSRYAVVGDVYRALEGNNSSYKWTNVRYTVTYADGTWNTSHAFTIQISVSNPFSQWGGYSSVYVAWRVTAVQTTVTGGSPGGEIEGRIFEDNSQVADCSHYLELTKSNESGPEHEIVYVNEYISNETQADYYGMSTLGFAVKSSGQIGGIGQLRAWVPTGINVYRLIERDNKPSNLFADLVYYLLTSKSQGVGNVVPAELIDVESLTIAAQFQRANRIFFDGVVEDSDSLRSFLYDNAALQLCNFTIKNGRFGMMPALPYDSNYEISTRPIPVEQIFTAGNIIEDSLQVQYIDAAQRANFRALVSWRVTIENDLPTQASALVDWADIPEGSRSTTQQAFDLTDFCTNRAQALKTARFLLSIRRRITHTVSFKTVPDALGIQPGSYIRVITAATSYSAANNGVITDAGTLVSITTIANGTYDAMVYNPATSQVLERKITISGGSVTDASLYGTLFTLLSETVNKGVYQVEQLTLDEDGLVNVAAVEVPVDSSGASIVARDVLSEGSFRVLE